MSKTVNHLRVIETVETDVLGEPVCAAMPGKDGLEDVGLLRLFDHDTVAPERFLALAAERRSVAGAAISDVLMEPLESGVSEDGRVYDLYPYLSGCSLATLTRRARLHLETYPLEVALWIVGRVAAGLSAAFRQEIAGETLQHGFVTPFLILISEEGCVRLCGVETAPALREMRGTASTFARILPYLSPESRLDEARHPSDDVYSLGAVLYELLTLKPLTSPSDLRDESSSIPSELRYFLARSVAPRFRRIQSVIEWLHELKSMVVQEGWIASATDLSAFFASLDDRLNPHKPDTSELTAADREIFARAIAKARADQKALSTAEVATDDPSDPDGLSDPEPSADLSDEDHRGRNERSYQTSVIARNILEPLAAEGHLIRTAHVKIVPDA